MGKICSKCNSVVSDTAKFCKNCGASKQYFIDEEIWGFALPTYTDGDIRSKLDEVKETKAILVFTPTSEEEIIDAISMGADGVYLDFISLLGWNNDQ